MTGNDGAHKFGHVVSVMFENRSFDNLLGTCTSRERSLRSRRGRPRFVEPDPELRAGRRAWSGAGARGDLDGRAQP